MAAGGAELVQLDVLDPASIAAAMEGVTAVVCATGFTPSFNLKKDNPAQVDHKGGGGELSCSIESNHIHLGARHEAH